MTMDVPGYESLQSVLQRAYDQAARTKGAERHANNLPFHEQPMQTVAAAHGVGFLLGQVSKKIQEAQGMLGRGETAKAVHELLGAINYTAGAVVFAESAHTLDPGPEEKEEDLGAEAPCSCPACVLRRILTAKVESETKIEVELMVADDLAKALRVLGAL